MLWIFFQGFATYVQYLGAAHAFPETHIRDQQLTLGYHDAFQVDALQSTKAILNPVTNPSFDSFFSNGLGTIPYAKGKIFTRCNLVKKL